MFSNVKDRMKNINKIYLVLDGPLQSLPLETLVSDLTINDNYREASWLVNDYELLYLTGVNDFISFKKKEIEKITFAKSYIAFADPNLSDNESATRSSFKIDKLFDNRGVIDIEEIKQLPSLPETAEEVKNISYILDANLAGLLNHASAPYFFDNLKIFSESVDTTILLNRLVFFA